MSLVERHSITIRGQGEKSMIFLHGYGCDQNIWRLLTPYFERSHSLVLYDQMGAGKSDLRAYDKASGKEVGAVPLPTKVTGSPMTYMVAGIQYVAVAVSGNGLPGRLVSYRLS